MFHKCERHGCDEATEPGEDTCADHREEYTERPDDDRLYDDPESSFWRDEHWSGL